MKDLYINNNIAVDNIRAEVLGAVVKKMKSNQPGTLVARQFEYDQDYTMLITNVRENTSNDKMDVDFEVFLNDKNANHSINKTIAFSTGGNALTVWEDFCDAASGGQAIYSRDLIGNFIIGHFHQAKCKYNDGVRKFDNVVVEKWIDRIDTSKVNVEEPADNHKRKRNIGNTRSVSATIMDDDDDDDDDFDEDEKEVSAETADENQEGEE